jgi:hypothetical protein
VPGIVWTLRKQQRTLVARLAVHALGLELILEMDGEVRYTAIARSRAMAMDEADRMRDTLLARGWTAD